MALLMMERVGGGALLGNGLTDDEDIVGGGALLSKTELQFPLLLFQDGV